MIRTRLYDIFKIIRASFRILDSNNLIVISSSTAFFATFSIAPICLILISLFGLIINDKFIRDEIYHVIFQIFGNESTHTVWQILHNLNNISSNRIYSLLGLAFLIFIATTLLSVIQNSINQIWRLKRRRGRKVEKMLRERTISFLMILASGVLIMGGFITQTALAFVKDYLSDVEYRLYFIVFINELISLIIEVCWFASIYRFLPAARMPWKGIWIGSIFTGILFSFGRFLLVRLLPESNIGNIYGASGSIILILLFVFYSSMIFYFGAAFIKSYCDFYGIRYRPKSYAVRFKIVEEL